MSDLTKCTSKDCEALDTCYRIQADSDIYQSFFVTPPGKDDTCEYYWKVQPTKETKNET